MDLINQAPVDLAVGDTEEWVTAAIYAVIAVAGTALVLRGRRGWALRFGLLLLAGSAICIVFEPALAHDGGFWYATVGQDLGLPTMWGVTVGVHMLLAYYVFLGVTTLFVIDYVRKGATARDLWRVYGAIFALAVVLELPLLWITDVYTYYGDNQPFFDEDYFPLPLWYPAINAGLPLAMATWAMLAGSSGRKWHLWLLPVLLPTGLFAIYLGEAWPVLTVLNSDVSKAVAWGGGAATIALALLVTHFLTLALPRLARSFRLPDETPAFPVAEAEPERVEDARTNRGPFIPTI